MCSYIISSGRCAHTLYPLEGVLIHYILWKVCSYIISSGRWVCSNIISSGRCAHNSFKYVTNALTRREVMLCLPCIVSCFNEFVRFEMCMAYSSRFYTLVMQICFHQFAIVMHILNRTKEKSWGGAPDPAPRTYALAGPALQ